MNKKLLEFNLSQRRTDIPAIRTGDVVRVTRKIKEGSKERSQIFEGMIIALKGGQSASRTMTVRKVSFGVGVELIFPLNSPQVEKVELLKRTKARRAKLYYVRHKSAKVLSRKLKEVAIKGVSESGRKKKTAVPENVVSKIFEEAEKEIVSTEEK